MKNRKNLPRVLVVDDEPQICALLGTLLSSDGYNVNIATNPLIALSRVEDTPPDLILLDVSIPILSGEDLASLLRRHVGDVPIIVITGHGDAEGWARRIGAVGFLRKPFGVVQLLSTVEAALRGAEAKQQLFQMSRA
jgi:DNA-binding response OmpR family regulator